jgi:lipopolysaccharide transport system permease protein
MPRSNYWNLLRELTLSQIKLRDQSSFFGFVWSFLNPLLLVAVLYVFFQTRLAENVQNFPLYLLIGVVQYNYFASGSNTAMHALHSMRQLTGEVVFPKEIIIVGSVLASSLEFVLEMIVIVVLAALVQLPLTGALFWLPFVVLMQVMFVLWVSFGLACLYVFVRDLEHLYSVLLRLLFFITPVFYSTAILGQEIARWIVLVNPLAQWMTMSRDIILDGIAPPTQLSLLLLLLNSVALFAAWRFFKYMEPHFAERV